VTALRPLFIGLLLTVARSEWAAARQPADTSDTRMIRIGGHLMRVQSIGLERRPDGAPVVVFEAGAANALEVWRNVVPQVATFAPVVAYDRAGLGRSEWDSETPTPRHVSTRLGRLLQAIGARPPYILVGYSWGGILTRYFAGYHPEDVAGIVLVDPGPIVTQTFAEQLAPFDSVGAGRNGYEAFWSGFAAFFQQSPPGIRAEFNVFRNLMVREPSDRDLRPLPPVPIVVLVAGKYLPLPQLQLPYDPRAHFEVDLRHRVRLLQQWAMASPEGTVVVTNHSTHAIPREDPGLIVWAVQRVLAAAGTPR
jgi:pimeloyl-ACP methyl ester carboxylesterase